MANPQSTASANDRLAFMLFLATALHAAIVLGISFDLFDPPNLSKTLEITLASFKTLEEVKEADYLAQANQKGSGSLEEKALPSTDQVSPIQENQIKSIAPPPQTAAEPRQVEKAQKKPLATLNKSPEQAPQLRQNKTDPAVEQAQKARQKIDLSAEIASLEAQFLQKRQQYAKRPRIHRITAASTMQDKGAYYKETWRRKIERVGNLNYPEEARRQKIYGQLTVLVALRPDGRLHEVKILKSSGQAVLDDAAIRIVKLAAPFAPFTPDLKDVDILEIIRTWKFEKSNILSSN
ncbi:energy transducer TonB [Aestuariirhabdus litorea]|uniref:Energy transducer TonB n=1 Tax=Aestuariirhabdus litorea TaxID=2528527 RepID=A0A3P3VPH0_9GAMM|nr:energy transducer TonB [Aestuariirhabdus litorea]RRJ82713.1 energy transducer TonB [Aestuariirhabdus litorea]RWW92873.1 TonB family protein [Endozoicomonadaceae bacterium GTF-13]